MDLQLQPDCDHYDMLLFADVGQIMISAAAQLFGNGDAHGTCPEEVLYYAREARGAPELWVTSECQIRWLIIARALHTWSSTSQQASHLMCPPELWNMLDNLPDFVAYALSTLHAGTRSCHCCACLVMVLLAKTDGLVARSTYLK